MSSVPLESAPVPEYFAPIMEEVCLGRPDLAETYYADTTPPEIVVVPYLDLPHDYEHAQRLQEQGLTSGRIFRHTPSPEEAVDLGVETGIAYPLDQNLIPLGELIITAFNSQMNLGVAQQDLATAFEQVGSALMTTHRRTGELPRDLTVDSICIARSNLHAPVEFMPPYTTTRELSPYDVVQNMRREVAERRVDDADSSKPDFDKPLGLRNFLTSELGTLAMRIKNGQIQG